MVDRMNPLKQAWNAAKGMTIYIAGLSAALLLVIGVELILVHGFGLEARSVFPSLYYIVPILVAVTIVWWLVSAWMKR